MHCIIKIKGHQEPYQEKKVFRGIFRAALNCHYTEEKAKKIASSIAKKVTAHLQKKVKKNACIGVSYVSDLVVESLEDRNVRLMYEHHMKIC